ncbi:insulinase family protein [Candidatus Roizmanbacteria bacterium]|nr:insulinase family protein [Candidatus Roizmanbacteria bacterium]
MQFLSHESLTPRQARGPLESEKIAFASPFKKNSSDEDSLLTLRSSSSRATHLQSYSSVNNNEAMKQWSNYYLDIIKEKFTKWSGLRQGYGGRGGLIKVVEKQKKSGSYIYYKKTEQTHFSLGFRAFSFKDARRYTLAVLSTILGGGASSRLFIEVRERRGLCYYIHTGPEHYHDVGYMTTQAGVTNNLETIKRAIDTILKEHKDIMKGKIKKEELSRAKEIIKGRILLSMEDSANVASWYGTKQILEGKTETVDDVIGKIQRVSGDEVIELAKQIFRPERLNLALVGPFKEEDFHGFIADYRGY